MACAAYNIAGSLRFPDSRPAKVFPKNHLFGGLSSSISFVGYQNWRWIDLSLSHIGESPVSPRWSFITRVSNSSNGDSHGTAFSGNGNGSTNVAGEKL